MAEFKSIEITFNKDLEIGENVYFEMPVLFLTYPSNHTWVNVRQSPNQVTKGTPIEDSPGLRSAINYQAALEADLAEEYGMNVTRTGNTVRIAATDVFYGFNWVEGSNDVSYVIDDETEDLFLITSVTFSAGINPNVNTCQNIRIHVETTIPIADLVSPGSANPNPGQNNMSFYIPRGQPFLLKLESEEGQTAEINFNNGIDVLSSDNLDLEIQNTPGGSNVVVNLLNQGVNNIVDFYAEVVGPHELELEYSLDGETWQDSNIFSGLTPGNYTLYVRDQFGCQTQKNFVTQEAGSGAPYFYISKSNSIRYANRVDFGDAANYKTDENTLSCEVNVPLPYTEIQQFQSADIIRTQFLSNYENITAEVLDLETNESTNIPIEQHSTNIDLNDSRDAIIYPLPDNKTGVYFITGNIYNYSSGEAITDYALNGNLPEWGETGNFVRIENAWYLIEEIIYDDAIAADVMVISKETSVQTDVIAKSIYDRRNYEIYEFEIDFFDFLNKTVQVRIINQDDNFGTITLLSEKINVKVKHPDTIEIRYKNKHNTDMFYMTGIEHKIRIPINKVSGQSDEETETQKTDSTTEVISATVHEGDEFEFEPVTKEIMRKIIQGLTHTNVLIDSVAYKKEAIEIEGPLGETNLYIVKASMIKSNNVFDSTSGNNEFATSNVEIPAFIDNGEDGFIQY